MNELQIKTHSFEMAKQELKAFSQQTKTPFELDKVDSSKGAGELVTRFLIGEGLGLSHKVTGAELNNLTMQLQSYMTDMNNLNIKFIKEFGQVYTALEALDEDYIQAILLSIRATEKTSERIEATQTSLKEVVDTQKKTLEVLKQFKAKLEGYEHLKDVDKMHKELHAISLANFKIRLACIMGGSSLGIAVLTVFLSAAGII